MKSIMISLWLLGIFLVVARADFAQDVCSNKDHRAWRTQQPGYLGQLCRNYVFSGKIKCMALVSAIGFGTISQNFV